MKRSSRRAGAPEVPTTSRRSISRILIAMHLPTQGPCALLERRPHKQPSCECGCRLFRLHKMCLLAWHGCTECGHIEVSSPVPSMTVPLTPPLTMRIEAPRRRIFGGCVFTIWGNYVRWEACVAKVIPRQTEHIVILVQIQARGTMMIALFACLFAQIQARSTAILAIADVASIRAWLSALSRAVSSYILGRCASVACRHALGAGARRIAPSRGHSHSPGGSCHSLHVLSVAQRVAFACDGASQCMCGMACVSGSPGAFLNMAWHVCVRSAWHLLAAVADLA